MASRPRSRSTPQPQPSDSDVAAADRLEAAMLRRAINGVQSTRRLANGTIEKRRDYPDALAIFLLKALRPRLYGAGAPTDVEAAPTKIITRAEMLARLAAVRGD